MDKKIIQESNSPFSSRIMLVQKRDGSVRFCIDHREFNAVTIEDAYPLSVIGNLLDAIGNSDWFSGLDCYAGYWSVPIALEDISKTAFCTQDGHYEFLRMPFGVCNGLATF